MRRDIFLLTVIMAFVGAMVCPVVSAGSAEEQTARWEAMLSGLRSEDFAERQRAVAELGDLPLEAIPWVESRLETAGADGDAELRSQLAITMRRLQRRLERAQLENGSPVEIDLEAAGPDEVLAAVNALGSLPLFVLEPNRIWSGEKAADFRFSGSYWGAVDHLLRVFPPDVDLAPEREDFGLHCGFTSLAVADLTAFGQPHVTSGLLRVRVGRTGFERFNGRDYFVLTLIPKVEPKYRVERLSLTVEGVELGDGSKLVPEDRARSFDADQGHGVRSFRPAPDFTWAIPLENPIDTSRAAKVEGFAELKLRRLAWSECELPALNESVAVGHGIRLAVTKKGDRSVEIKIEGEGNQHYSLRTHNDEAGRRFFTFRDADGGEVGFDVIGSGGGSGGGKWHQTFNCRFKKGEPVSVRLLLPGEREEIQMPVVFDAVPLPLGGGE